MRFLFGACILSALFSSVLASKVTPPHESPISSEIGGRIPDDRFPFHELPPAHYFGPQNIDHFNAHNQHTFGQRFFVNDTFWNPNQGPIFVVIEGEGAASPFWALYGHHMELAQKYGALVFVVEHRYYGGSIPTEDLSTKNLQWLSSEQALADLAVFLEDLAEGYNLDIGEDGRNKVITFGGSYSGALSAWFRIKYPHIVYGSVASSAPVEAKLDFYEFNQVVAKSLANSIVGGSTECARAIYEGFQEIDSILDSNKHHKMRKLENDFNSCSRLTDELDQISFVRKIARRFKGAVQYNGPWFGVYDVCNFMLDGSYGETPLQRLARLTVGNDQECIDYSWATRMSRLKNDAVGLEEYWGARQWIYQTCTEFGYYETCEPWKGTCLFSSRMNVASHTQLCDELFGFHAKNVEDRIQFSNDYYGGSHPDASRIVFVNGGIDPWHALSVLESDESQDVTAIVIPDGSHCQNMHHSSPFDSESMQAAKLQIDSIVGRWVQ